MPNIVQYCLILSNITKYLQIVINIAQYCPVLFNIVQVTISAHSYQKYDIASNIQILCKIYPNIVRHWLILSSIESESLAAIWSQSSHFVTFLAKHRIQKLILQKLVSLVCYLKLWHKKWKFGCNLVTKQLFHHFLRIIKLLLQKLLTLVSYLKISHKS